MTHEYYDITIIGGGPVGMFTATYARMHLAKTQIIDSLAHLGGQVKTLYPTKKIYDIPGFPALTGEELIFNLQNQMQRYQPDVFLNESVIDFEQTDIGYKITTTQRVTYSKTIIIATGVGAFNPRKLKIENHAELEDKKLHYFINNPAKFANKTIAIAGGGDSAIDWALELSECAQQIHIIHRRDKFRALPASVAKLKATSAQFETPYAINELSLTTDQRLKISLKSRSDQKEIIVDDLIVNYGFCANNSHLRKWELDIEQRGIKVARNMETSRPNVFAVGDAVSYPGRSDLIATGFGEGPIAVNAALSNLDPSNYVPGHSTSLIHD
ncbi:pyridine nucleotide-disulfide family oxidoreductase [Ligilactobacillus ceti DSM 22408]|uniref:Ferredoxin--NADP reductase n=1 Tax=Ligilactobacillus ceti DSM 22408 TaxID=1122146 RepID=A0A0R2KUL9_9LACO|nr:NAD(P)/FAD-dependent oxidoreductase [Ligilactobacillus ceti]KRN89956.1 pyridine nucleotide-disulfide family oxidoreductase [Ligilactobacillus ceti DSM 22408]